MGFYPEEDIYRLRFEDPKLKGLVVDIEPVSVGTVIGFTDMASLASLAGTALTDMDADMLSSLSGIGTLFDSFAEALVAWNVEDKQGNPVPPTKAGVYKQKFPFLMRIISAWTESIAGVSENLDGGSNVGSLSGVASIPTETLSPSRVS